MDNIPEKQGELRNLDTKSKDEIEYLLRRQQGILANKKFIQRLPDKGQKIKSFVEKLQTLLQEKEEVDNTAALLQNMTLDAERQRAQRTQPGGDTQLEDGHQLEALVNREMNGKVVIREPQIADSSISQELRDLEMDDDHQTVNCYENIISKADKPSSDHTFKPYRTLKTTDLKDLPGTLLPESKSIQNESEMDSTSGSVQSSEPHRICLHKGPKYDESLLPPPTEGKHVAAQMLPIEESMKLQQEQKIKLERLQAQHAMQRLAERTTIRTTAFQPEGAWLPYRDNASESEDDEGSDSDDLDGPD